MYELTYFITYNFLNVFIIIIIKLLDVEIGKNVAILKSMCVFVQKLGKIIYRCMWVNLINDYNTKLQLFMQY